MVADDQGWWTCCVAQGHYGHRAQKFTWLYAIGCRLPSLRWGKARGRARLDQGYHSAEERAFRSNRRLSPEMRRRKSEWMDAVEVLSANERAATPLPFRDLLLSIARTAAKEGAA